MDWLKRRAIRKELKRRRIHRRCLESNLMSVRGRMTLEYIEHLRRQAIEKEWRKTK